MNTRLLGIVALGLIIHAGTEAKAQVFAAGSQAVHISVAGRTSNGPGQMIDAGLLRFQEFKAAAAGVPNITAVAVEPNLATSIVLDLVSQLMETLNILALGYQQSVLAAFEADSTTSDTEDTTGSIGSDSLDDFFGDISGGG